MKIEIESSEFVAIQNENSHLKNKIFTLEEKLNELDEKELIDSAFYLADQYTLAYLKAIFKALGFNSSVVDFRPQYLKRKYGKKWFDIIPLEVKISAHISKQYKKAFINIGVNEEILTKDEEIDKLTDIIITKEDLSNF